MYSKTRYLDSGDSALVVEFGNQINEEINRKVRNFDLAIKQSKFGGIKEVVPTYRSLLIYYDPLEIKRNVLVEKLKELENNLDEFDFPQPKLVEIPTLYGYDFGPDLDYVAHHNGLTKEEVIKIHSEAKYLIYMLGFTPGFVYLGGMEEKIATPRLKEPRTTIPAGSVGIADNQTGIYPIESPGGWQLIGVTPLKLFDPGRDSPILPGISAGNYITFKPIDKPEYREIVTEFETGRYELEIKDIKQEDS